jgi:glycerate-2-kinase
MPPAVLDHLAAGGEGRVPETPIGGEGLDRQTIAIIADAPRAAAGAAEAACKLGWEPTMVSATVTGEARAVAAQVVEAAQELRPGELLIYAGETTVTVTGDGKGGRNQELALAAAVGLAGSNDLVLLSAGTDGIDGATEAAGAFADGWTVERGRRLRLDPADFLDRNDSFSYLSAVGDVIVTGPTGTNVGDLILVARSG